MHPLAEENPSAYAFLLGEYLGDGVISRNTTSYKLAVHQDNAYPHVIRSIAKAIERVIPDRKARLYDCSKRKNPSNKTDIVVFHPELVPLFPQHGPGRKHKRSIKLTDWQREIVSAHPGDFLRGLIWSDGCRYWEKTHADGRAYPKYTFCNKSADIVDLFEEACEMLGVSHGKRSVTQTGLIQVKVCQALSVMKLDQHVGPKDGSSTKAYWKKWGPVAEKREQTRIAKASVTCKSCGTSIWHTALRCRRCMPYPEKIQWPAEEQILEMLAGSSYRQVGADLGVSDNAVRKHLRRCGITPSRDLTIS